MDSIKRIWAVLAFVVILAGLALGWYGAQQKVTAFVDTLMDRERAAGHQLACSSQQKGGFPFGISRSCSGLQFSDANSKATLADLTASWSVLSPNAVSVSLASPSRFEAGPFEIISSWDSSVTRYGGILNNRSWTDVAVRHGDLSVKSSSGLGHFTFERFDASATPGVLKPQDNILPFSVKLDRFRSDALAASFFGSEALDIKIEGVVDHLDVPPLSDAASAAEKWRLAEGRVRLSAIELHSGDLKVTAQANAGLDPQHRAFARLDAQISGLVPWLEKHGLSPKSNFMSAAFVQMMQVEQVPGVGEVHKVTLVIENGRAKLGAFPLPFALAPLY